MAQFEKKKFDLNQINDGQKYVNGQVLSAETINKVIEAAAYAQDVERMNKDDVARIGDLEDDVAKIEKSALTADSFKSIFIGGNGTFGFTINNYGMLELVPATEYEINDIASSDEFPWKAITLGNFRKAVKEGLVNNYTTLTEDECKKIQSWLGIKPTYEHHYRIESDPYGEEVFQISFYSKEASTLFRYGDVSSFYKYLVNNGYNSLAEYKDIQGYVDNYGDVHIFMGVYASNNSLNFVKHDLTIYEMATPAPYSITKSVVKEKF